jgi:hypothetical protein
MLVGDYRNGNLYHFELRAELSLSDSLQDRTADSPEELDQILIGGGFGAITDLQVGPYDGYLYFLSLGNGALYRIIAKRMR